MQIMFSQIDIISEHYCGPLIMIRSGLRMEAGVIIILLKENQVMSYPTNGDMSVLK